MGNVKISEVVPDIDSEDYIKKNLMLDYQNVNYKFPIISNYQDLKIDTKAKSDNKEEETTVFLCSAKEVVLAHQGVVGYALMFKEPSMTMFGLRNKKGTVPSTNRNKAKIEWIYDAENFVFARMATENTGFDSEIENVNSVRSRFGLASKNFKSVLNPNTSDGYNSEIEEENDDDRDESIFVKLAKKYNKRWNKPNYAKGITTMRISSTGNFIIISRRKLAENQNVMIKEVETPDYEPPKAETNNAPVLIMNTSLKSRKDLVNAIMNHKGLPALTYLNCLYFLFLIILITMSSVDYGMFISYYKKIINNTDVFSRALNLNAKLLQGVVDTRNLILAGNSQYTSFENLDRNGYVIKVKERMDSTEQEIDSTYKEISGLTDILDKVKKELITDSNLSLYFSIGGNVRITSYTLAEAIIMFSSRLFQISNSQSQITEADDNVYFVFKNGLNALFQRYQSFMYTMEEDMSEYTATVLAKMLVVTIVAICAIFAGSILVIPIAKSINESKEKILMLFFQIKRNNAKGFANQCQQFYGLLQRRGNWTSAGSDGDGEDDLTREGAESAFKEGDTMDDDSCLNDIAGPGTRKLKKKTFRFVLLVVISLFNNIILSSYFVFSYALFGKYLFDANNHINTSLTDIAQINSGYYMNYIALRELVLNSGWTVDEYTSLGFAQNTTANLTRLEIMVESNFDLSNAATSMYFKDIINYLDAYFESSLCSTGRNNYFENTADCVNFAFQIPDKGTYALLSFIVELSKEILLGYNYVNFTASFDYLNGIFFSSIRIAVDNFVYYNMQMLTRNMTDKLKAKASLLMNIKTGVFIGYLFLYIILFIFLWNPFVSKQRRQYNQTNSMISIIPFEVVKQATDIQKYALDNVIFSK